MHESDCIWPAYFYTHRRTTTLMFDLACRLRKKKLQYPRDTDSMKNNIYNLKKTDDEETKPSKL